jgi:hypothetical protein
LPSHPSPPGGFKSHFGGKATKPKKANQTSGEFSCQYRMTIPSARMRVAGKSPQANVTE